MSADSFDNFPYEPDAYSTSEEQRRHYWAVAIGLQAVDGLEVSSYARELAQGYVRGDYTLAQTGQLLRGYHQGCDDAQTREADLVAQRIAELLAAKAFTLAPDMLFHIHHVLFQDMDLSVYCPGERKTVRLVKQEEILNGDSVLYADPAMVNMSLDYLFREESRRSQQDNVTIETLPDYCAFIANVWQVHPFVEGNTRTVAVFSELYLGQLGFQVANEPFEHHARYYRDALVRANYRNPQAGILPNHAFLQRFYENVVFGGQNDLNREDLLCLELFDNPQLLRNVDPSLALSLVGQAEI